MKTITEYIAIGVNGVRVIKEQEAKENKTDNIYFLEGVRADKDYSNGQRAKDEDIILKDMFVLDLDIRNNCEDKIGNEEIKELGNGFINYLEQEDKYFGEWSKIVFTGNGLHIYYSGIPTQFTKEQYSMGVERIYKQWDNIMGDKIYNTDHACKNLARILRLPGSINQKNGATVEILASREKESRLFNLIKQFAIKQQEEQNKLREERELEIKQRLKSFSSKENKFYDEINLIPAYQIAQLLVPDFPYDGKKNFNNEKGGLTGYFYNKETNTIANGGSRYFNWGDTTSCWNNFSLVKHFKNWNDKEVFYFYKTLLGKN